jgi:hypothetical protein
MLSFHADDIVDRFNSQVEVPEHNEAFEHFCDGYINKHWKASYEMLTGAAVDPLKEKIRVRPFLMML